MAKFTLHHPTPAVEPEIDPAALEAFAAGARERRIAEGELPPWERFDPSDKPRYNVAIRLNDHQLAMLRYLAEARDTSQSKLLQKHLLPILRQLALEEFEARRVKASRPESK
jgi:hypothetical protein